MDTESGEFIRQLAEEAQEQMDRSSPIATRINSILQRVASASAGN